MSAIREIYSQVCSALLEPGALQLGIWSDQEFLDAYRDVAVDWLQRTGTCKKFAAVVQEFGVGQYTFPDFAMELQHLFSDEKALFHGDVDDLDAAIHDWIGQVRTPQQWRDDQLPMKTAEVFPAPAASGNEVLTPDPNGYFGTLASVTAGDMTITAQTNPVVIPFFGTISRSDGTTYLESAGPFYGTLANVIESKTNILAVATATLFNKTITIDSVVELIADCFLPFIKYGVLSRLFSKDGEGRNDFGAKHCAGMYEDGVMIGKAIMNEAMMEEAA